MAADQEPTDPSQKNQTPDDEPKTASVKIDRNAPAGSENSLGAESVREGRPATDDDVIEAMDEEGPGIGEVDGKQG